jgi:hypothetical protein
MHRPIHLLALLLCVLCGCSGIGGERLSGGNTSEVGNGAVVGVLYRPGGARAAGATVHALPAGHPGTPEIDTFPSAITNDQGEYALCGVDTGYHSIEATLDTLGTLIDSIEVRDTTAEIRAPDDTLRAFGAVTGVVVAVNNPDPYFRFLVYVPGSSWGTVVYADSAFLLAGLPAGPRQIMLDGGRSAYGSSYWAFVTAGDTLDIDTVFIQPRW